MSTLACANAGAFKFAQTQERDLTLKLQFTSRLQNFKIESFDSEFRLSVLKLWKSC